MGNKPVFILLAGGKSERMGIDKGLLKYNDSYWILEQLYRISQSSIEEVYIGLGFNFNAYLNAIPWFKTAQLNFVNYKGLKVKVILNKNPKMGSFSTLQTVLKKIPLDVEVIINHIDIPILNSEELEKIISTKNSVVIPNFKGKNGHPIKLNSFAWNNLTQLNCEINDARLDVQLKKINPIKISIIEVFDRAILLNLNTKKDWISFISF